MGDHFRTIVDPFASAENAPVLAEKVIKHLIDRKIIGAELISEKEGYPPGANVEEALARWRDDVGWSPADDLRRWQTSGLEAAVGRTVFHNFGAGLNVVRCPLCLSNQKEANWGDAIDHWYRGDDQAPFRCPHCKESSPITHWLFDPPWAFGHLGFYLWNWPPLKRSFIEEISAILGHKIVMIAGTI